MKPLRYHRREVLNFCANVDFFNKPNRGAGVALLKAPRKSPFATEGLTGTGELEKRKLKRAASLAAAAR
jgi:hypothetical protein